MKLLENKREMRKNFDESFRISTCIMLSYYETNMYINMPFFKPGSYQRQSVNLRTETCVLFFEETCFFWDNSLYLKICIMCVIDI